MKEDTLYPDKLMQVKRRTTHRNYLFGDFDRDGVKNIDDFKPFDPKVSKFPDPRKNPRYYHKARYGGFDTKFSDVLLGVERYANKHAPGMKSLLKEHKGSYGRIKTVPSIIQKSLKYRLPETHDIAGVTILTSNRKQVYAKVKAIKKRHKTNSRRSDDFYKNPKGGVYFAHHLEVTNPFAVEVQVKTRKMEKLHKKMHTAYKKDISLSSFEKEAKKLFKLGF